MGALVNMTIDDTSSQIAYVPADSWHPSNVPCTGCLSPSQGLAFQGTWHDGTHTIPTIDGDDVNGAPDTDNVAAQPAAPPPSSPSPSPPPPPPPPAPTHDADDGGGDGKDQDKDKGKGKGKGDADDGGGGGGGKNSRRQDLDNNPFFIPNLDSDDAGFVDKPVFAQFNFTGAFNSSTWPIIICLSQFFGANSLLNRTTVIGSASDVLHSCISPDTGSAVYVYALVPTFAAPANSTPTFMNLTFELNSLSDGQYSHTGTAAPANSASTSSSAYLPNTLVYTRSGLSEGFHSLRIDVGPDSVFLLDYIIYSQDDGFANGGNGTHNDVSTTPGGASPTALPSPGPSASSTGCV